jgi:hypothetical protein
MMILNSPVVILAKGSNVIFAKPRAAETFLANATLGLKLTGDQTG